MSYEPEIGPRIQTDGHEILTGTCYRDYGVRNAAQLRDLLSDPR